MTRELARRIVGVVIRGALLGGLLAVMTPPQAVSAGTCACGDNGANSYKCHVNGQSCIAGSETCIVVCG